MLRSFCKLNKSDFILSACVMGGLFLLVHVITLIVLALTHASSSVLLSGAVLPVSGGICLFVSALAIVLLSHDLNLTMGCTRRCSLGLISGYLAAQWALYLAFCWGCTALERILFPPLWTALFHFDRFCLSSDASPFPGSSEHVLFVEEVALDWFWPLVILLAGLALGFTVGTGIRRFGPKFAWAVWLLSMLVLYSFTSGLLHQPYLAILLAVGAVLLVLAFVWSIYELLHCPVHT